MKILFTLSQLEVTGAEVFAVTCADALIKKGHPVYIVSDTLTKPTNAFYQSLSLANRKVYSRIRNVIALKRFINDKGIDIVVANSRAAAWVSTVACRLCGIPLITVIHGRQATFLSRKIFHGFGIYSFAVCEKLKEQLLGFFNVPEYKVEVLRNPFDIKSIKPSGKRDNKKNITLIGRLSGPKGELAFKLLEFYVNNKEKIPGIKFRVVGGKTIPKEFERFKEYVEFTGFVNGIEGIIEESSVIIGSGRIAMESILRNKPTIAIGEACSIGLITKDNIDFALQTNFGDMNERERDFDFKCILESINKALQIDECGEEVYKRACDEFDLEKIVDRMESVCLSILTVYHRREIPVIYYHKVIKDQSDAGKNGIYVTCKQFEGHLNYLKKNNYKSVTIEQALELKYKNEWGRYAVITFDDGYEDNYLNAFPLLKKYGFNAEIFLVAGLTNNEWDKNGGEPDSPMLKKEQIIEMHNYGVKFGSHTLKHADLTKCDDNKKEEEIAGSKKSLEEKLGIEINSIAYPYGNYDDKVLELAIKAGYKYGLATDRAPLSLHEHLFKMRRIAIFPNTTNFHFRRKVNGNYIFKKIKEEKEIFNFHKQNSEV